MYQNILSTISNNILTITINRESKLNALNQETLTELNLALLNAFEDVNVNSIIITGTGNKAFVAGADIAELTGLSKTDAFNLSSISQSKVFNLLAQSPKPTIAAINGFALGGGLELALCCHIRIASENAQMGLPEVTLGLIPGYGGTQRLPQLIGKSKALELILTGKMIDAHKGYEIGLINHVVAFGESVNKANEILNTIAKNSPLAVASAIQCVNLSDQESGYQTEIQEFSNCFETDDFVEGTEAFLKKRPAIFTNKNIS